MKKCPYCTKEIQDEAILCRYCGKEFAQPPKENVDPINFEDWFEDLFQIPLPNGDINKISLSNDLEKIVYRLSKDVQFRKLFFTNRNKAIEGYTLTTFQLEAIQITTLEIFELAGIKRILNAVLNAETQIKADPSAKRCDACNGLGFKVIKKQSFLGSLTTTNTCTECSGNGFHRNVKI